jgi:hypothetical protein
MSTFHTPRCRIRWTAVHNQGIDRNVVVHDQVTTFWIGVWLDPTLKATPGYAVFEFRVVSVPQQYQSQEVYTQNWLTLTPNLPWVGDCEYNMTFSKATNLTNGQGGWFMYEPRISIVLPGGPSMQQFAYPEAPHYILIAGAPYP